CSPRSREPTPPIPSFPTRRSSDLENAGQQPRVQRGQQQLRQRRRGSEEERRAERRRHSIHRHHAHRRKDIPWRPSRKLYSCPSRSEEHTSELQSLRHLVCRLLLEK